MRQIDHDHVDLTRRRLRLPDLAFVHANHVYPQPQHRATLDFSFIHIEVMRRAQSVRHYTRASVPTIGTDDLGVVKEVPEESTEVALRRQLLDKSKENDKVCNSSSFKASTLVTLLLIRLPPFAAPRPDSGTTGAAHSAATDRSYSGVTKGIQ
jgi:hypothetical protein